jgi:hypothetical protein
MSFRIITLNPAESKVLEKRRQLIVQELDRLKPDLVARNKVSIPATDCALAYCLGAVSSYDGL